MSALKTAQDARLAARPEKPDGYALEFGKDFKPEIAIKFDDKDPRVGLLREFAHKNNWTQAEFSEALQIEAANVVAETKADAEAHAAEMKKLGANGTARVTAARTWLAGILGEKPAQAMIDRLVLATDIESLEKLQQAFTTQGGAGFNGSGREPKPPAEKPLAQKLWPLRQTAS